MIGPVLAIWGPELAWRGLRNANFRRYPVIRTAFGKIALIALTTAVAGVAMVGCSGDNSSKKTDGGQVADGKQGGLGLNLQPVSGVLVNVVSYKVTQGAAGAVVKAGNLSVPGNESTFSFGVPLPVGTGYVLSLEAVSVDGKVTCAGSAGPFNILANQSSDITPTLTCTDISTGQPIVDVNVVTTACPDITFDYVIATPSHADVGKTIALFSNAVSASATALKYSWQIATPAVGSFANPLLKDPVLTCNNQGENVVVTVTADNNECTKSLTTKISCANVLCGNGVLDPGESCDKALDATCPTDCKIECGDGVIEGSEACEPPNTASCKADCSVRVAECLDGFLTAPEQCDPTAGSANCDQTCKPVAGPAVCGNGQVEAGETCDNGAAGNYVIADCGGAWGPQTAIAEGGRTDDCNVITPAACLACENGSECAELVGTALLSGNAAEGPAVGTSRAALYNEVLDCVRDTHCATGLIVDCYCGTASSAACDAGNGNGACRTQIERGVETVNPSDVQARLTNLTLGGGLAMARVACDQNNCGQCL
jgi:hypothetical protein